MTPVGSSWVHSYGYDRAASELHIQFKDKAGNLTAHCVYPSVPLAMWTDFQAAGSKGQWVHRNLMHPSHSYRIV